MVFPQTPLDVELAILVDGAWDSTITPYVFGREGGGVSIFRGAPSEGQSTDPGRMSFELDNRGGRFTPKNPTSPYYGKIGRNTRIRASVYTGDTYLDLPPEISGGHYASTPDAAALDITGDIDIRFEADLVNWQSNFEDPDFRRVELLGKVQSGGNHSWVVFIYEDRLVLEWSADGTNTLTATSTIAPTIPQDGRLTIRVTLDVNNGAGGRTTTFYTGTGGVEGSFTQLGEAVTDTGTTSIFSSTAILRVGEGSNVLFGKAKGKVLAAQVRNGIGGSVVANPDFTAQTDGATSFVDSAGRTWSLSGSAAITNRQDRFQGRVTAWPSRWSTGGFDPYVDVQADGVLRRLSRGTTPLDSAMRREFGRDTRIDDLVAYWPMEDGSESTSFASARPGDDPLVISGDVSPGAFSTYGASGVLPTFDDGSAYAALTPHASTGEVALRFAFSPSTVALSADATVVAIYTTGNDIHTWAVRLDTSNRIYLRGYGDAGAVFTSSTLSLTGGRTYSVGLELDQNGADIDYSLFAYDTVPVDLGFSLSSPGTVSGTPVGQTLGRARAARVGLTTLSMGGAAVGHLAISTAISAFTATAPAIAGYFGEKAATRFARLCQEENVRYSRHVAPIETGRSSLTVGYNINTLMGTQGELSLMGALRECEDTLEGVLYESRAHGGLVLRDAASLASQTAAVVIDYTGSDGLVAPFDPTDDDNDLVNQAEVDRVSGATGVYTKTSGPLNISEPEDDPEGVGLYRKGYSRDLYADSATVQHAGWLVNLGTCDDPRYPRVRVLLQKAVSKIPEYIALDVGSIMEVVNLPDFLPPDQARLMVRGYSEFLSQYRWELTFNCAPAAPFDVATLDSDTFGRVDTAGSEIAAAVDSDDTVLQVFTTSGPVWTTDSGQYPFDVLAAGERMTASGATSSGSDDFSAAVAAGGWGTADIGGAWSVLAGTASRFSVAGGEGLVSVNAVNTLFAIGITAPAADVDVYATVDTSALATGASQRASIVARWTDSSNFYEGRVAFNTNQTATISIVKTVAGLESSLGGTVTLPAYTHAANTPWRIRFKVDGSNLYLKAWPTATEEPQAWRHSTSDTALTAAGSVGVRSHLTTGNTNALPVTFTWDNFEIVNPQRMTVTRSDNGVVKSHAAGTSISLDRPVKLGL